MIQYPAELPLPLQEGYGLSTVDPMRATQMVTGRTRYRVRHSYVPTEVKFNFNFSLDEAGVFEAWYARTLNNGLEWFEIKLQTPAGFATYQAHFKGIYQGPDLTQITRWRYSAVVQLKERPLIPAPWEQFPQYWTAKNIIDLSINNKWPAATFDYPTYAAAMQSLLSLRSGISITIQADETQLGNRSVYRVVRADSPSLSLDFISAKYQVGQPSDYLELENTYAS